MKTGSLERKEKKLMGTTRCGRYMNTKGNRLHASDFSLVHSIEGKFRWRDKKDCKDGKKSIRLDGGGHGEEGIKLLDKYGIKYNIVKTYSNGVRVGNIPDHRDKRKQSGIGQAWFPSSWDRKKIKRAGEHVAHLKKNRNTKDGITMWGTYKGVRVGVINTNGQIATIFPDSIQMTSTRRKRR